MVPASKAAQGVNFGYAEAPLAGLPSASTTEAHETSKPSTPAILNIVFRRSGAPARAYCSPCRWQETWGGGFADGRLEFEDVHQG